MFFDLLDIAVSYAFNKSHDFQNAAKGRKANAIQ